MNAERRLAGFTAVNIDGKRIKAVNRDDKTVIENPTLKDLGVESLGLEGAEASDAFRPDRRILPEEQMNKPFYESRSSRAFRIRIRLNARRGCSRKAISSCAAIRRGEPSPGGGRGKRHVLLYQCRAAGRFLQPGQRPRPSRLEGQAALARGRDLRPAQRRHDEESRQRLRRAGVRRRQRPLSLRQQGADAVLEDRGLERWIELRSIALLADQRPVIKVMPEAIGAEAFGDEEELARVSEFLSTVKEIEELTGLDFSRAIRDADIRAGMPANRRTAALTLRPSEVREPRRGRTGRRVAGRKRATAKRKR